MEERQINYETGEIVEPNRTVLFAKLARVMGSLKRLPKSGHNAHFNYDYVTDGDVADAVRNALAAEGVAFLVSMRNVQTDGKKTLVTFSFTFACGETGATWSCDWQGEAMDTQDKGTAKAATSALKYFLLKNFILSTGDPADDTDATGKTKQKATRAGVRPEAAPPGGTGAAKPEPSPDPSTNGEALAQSKAAFYAQVLKDIPFYHNAQDIGAALKAAGFTAYSQAKEDEMLAALQKHANEKANKKANEQAA